MSSTRSSLSVSAILALLVVICGNNIAGAQEKLFGTWKVQFFARVTEPADVAEDDAAVPSRVGDEIEIVIDRNKLVLVWGGTKSECKLKLVAKDADSGQMTITHTDKNGREDILLGIYMLKDGILSLCLSGDEDKKPTNFEIKYSQATMTLMRLRKK